MAELVCTRCGKEHEASTSRCPCGGALDHAEPLGPVPSEALTGEGVGLARFGDVVGIPPGDLVTLGEGTTPLIEAEAGNAHLKLEGANPTGSFKDRGAAVVVSHAKRVGAECVVEDSSGNAGAAVAAYAARAGLGCTVFSPEHVTPAKRARMETLGAEVRVVDGPRTAVTEAAVAAGREDAATYYASHTYPPYFVDGCASIAFELVDQLGGVPDAVVTPCAMGSIVLGCYRGFSRLVEGGVIDEVPPIFAVQAAGVDPIADAFGNASPESEGNRFADGLLVPEPPRRHQLVEAIEATGGTAISVDEAATREAMHRLHRQGVLAEPSSATALAGADQLRSAGEIDAGQRPALVLTGRWTPG